MGNENSNNAASEAPRPGEASPLYWTCRSGDVQAAREILSSQQFSDMNQLETNGSTALHAAAFFGHDEIVYLLLHEYGVIRHRKNRHGLTAFQEASTHSVRQLFQRPENNRFSSHDNVHILFDLHNSKDNTGEVLPKKPNTGWVDEYSSNMDSYISLVNFRRIVLTNPVYQTIMKTMFTVFFFSDNAEKIMIRNLGTLVDENIPKAHREYHKARELLSEYKKKKKLEPLMCLYSLETPFYKNLGQDKYYPLFFLLLWRLKTMKNRAFQGRSFRGLTMTNGDLEAYKWALSQKGSLIRTCSFCSTSLEEKVARQFMAPSIATDKKSVLMILDFPEPCDTAIALYTLSDELPCISDFENEQEVLILPTTMFKVTNIQQSANMVTIYMENMNEFSVLNAIKKGLVSE